MIASEFSGAIFFEESRGLAPEFIRIAYPIKILQNGKPVIAEYFKISSCFINRIIAIANLQCIVS